MKEKVKKKKETKREEKVSKSKVNAHRVIIALMMVFAAIYILCVVVLLNTDETDTIFVEQGTIHQEETVVGYIIRNEQVIRNEEYQNGIIQIAGEGEKVHKGEAIFQYYSDEAKQISNQIVGLDLQIQEQLKKEKVKSNTDIKLIENQIEEQVEKLRELDNTQEISEYNKTIKTLLERKISILPDINGASEDLKQLARQRIKLDEQIRSSTKYLTAPISGVVSYRIDNLEQELTTQDFSKYSTKYLEKLNLKTGQIISTSSDAGKVIDNFTYYIATPMESEESKNVKIGQKVTIRFSTNDEIQAQIVHINEENDKRVIILKIDRLTEKLINYRKISFEVVWWSDTGLKVPNKAITKDENGLAYLVRTRSGDLSKILVKIVNSNENYSIVTAYSTEELTELGFTQEQISNYGKIKLYDEVLLYPSSNKEK